MEPINLNIATGDTARFFNILELSFFQRMEIALLMELKRFLTSILELKCFFTLILELKCLFDVNIGAEMPFTRYELPSINITLKVFLKTCHFVTLYWA